MENNLKLYEQCRVVPENAMKAIMGGRLKGMTDINPMWRIKKLTEEFGPCGIGWYYKPINRWLEKCGNEICAFTDIELFVKSDGEWSMPICGTGGSKLSAQESGGIHISDECYKMATTDALSVACKQLGIGADVYFSSDRTKYDQLKKEEQKINASQIEWLRATIDRIGAKEIAVCLQYKVKKIEELTAAQYVDAIGLMAQAPDKVKSEDVEKDAPFK